MIFLDCRPGVTFSLLLKAVAGTAGNGAAALSAASADAAGPLRNLLAQAWAKPTIDEIVLALQSGCAGLPPLPAGTAGAPERSGRRETAALLEMAGAGAVDPFEFSAYISLSVLLGKGETAWQLLKPGVGAGSPEKVFTILHHTAVSVSPAARPVSPFLAAFLKTRFAPFAERAGGGRFVEAVTLADPAEPRSVARAFRYDEGAGASDEAGDEVAVIEANLDDMTPEILARAMQVLLDNGALDFAVVPVGMKKGRPGFRAEVLARLQDREKIEELLLLHTSTFGVRTTLAERRVLERSTEYFDSSYGRLRVKRGFYRGKLVRTVPEYEDLADISAKRGVPLIRLYADVMAEIARESS